jgi:hypothetical protein
MEKVAIGKSQFPGRFCPETVRPYGELGFTVEVDSGVGIGQSVDQMLRGFCAR